MYTEYVVEWTEHLMVWISWLNLYGKLYDVSLPESFATEENNF